MRSGHTATTVSQESVRLKVSHIPVDTRSSRSKVTAGAGRGRRCCEVARELSGGTGRFTRVHGAADLSCSGYRSLSRSVPWCMLVYDLRLKRAKSLATFHVVRCGNVRFCTTLHV